jgi:hypothetical protein
VTSPEIEVITGKDSRTALNRNNQPGKQSINQLELTFNAGVNCDCICQNQERNTENGGFDVDTSHL